MLKTLSKILIEKSYLALEQRCEYGIKLLYRKLVDLTKVIGFQTLRYMPQIIQGAFSCLLAINNLFAASSYVSGLDTKDLLEGEKGQIREAAHACRFVQSNSFKQDTADSVSSEYEALEKYALLNKVTGYVPIAAIAFLSRTPKVNMQSKNTHQLIIAFQGAEQSQYENLITLCQKNAYSPNELTPWFGALVDSKLSINTNDNTKDDSACRRSNQYLKGAVLWALQFTQSAINEAQKKYGKDNIKVVVCGHALGGVYAQIIGRYLHYQFYVFNSPGVKGIVEFWGTNPFVNLGFASNSRAVDGLSILLGSDFVGQQGSPLSLITSTLSYQDYKDSTLKIEVEKITLIFIKKYLDTKRDAIKVSFVKLCIKVDNLERDQITECQTNNCKHNWIFHSDACRHLSESIRKTKTIILQKEKEVEEIVKILKSTNFEGQAPKKAKLQKLNSINSPVENNVLVQTKARLVKLGYNYENDNDFDSYGFKREVEIYTRLRQHSIEAVCDFIDGKMTRSSSTSAKPELDTKKNKGV